jgi:alpha,alpha-trehalose phosphorylase
VLRKRLVLPSDITPIDPWRIELCRLAPPLLHEYVGQAETGFALANGFLGIRGSHEEDQPSLEPGTFLNGFFEHRPIVYGEHAYGFPPLGQTLLNCPDGKIIKLYVDDEPFNLNCCEILQFHRSLELREGTLHRDVVFETLLGKRVRVSSTRLVSFRHRHLAAIRYQVTVENSGADLIIASQLINRQPLPRESNDPRLGQRFIGRVLHPAGSQVKGLRALLSYTTRSSGFTLGCGMDHCLRTEAPHSTDVACDDDLASVVFKGHVEAGQSVTLDKYLSYHYGHQVDPLDIRAEAGWTLDKAVEQGFEAIAADQRRNVQAFWDHADVQIEGGETPEKQQVVRWNLFQLLQASARAEGHGISARGLTGQTYEGHYFWDTEIYVLPFLIYTNPRAARGVLKFRYAQLDKARERARELGHRGATFPWRTIDGHEASAYYAAGTAQYHINADIAYAIRKYVDVTGDQAFLRDYGAEVLVETARFWLDLGAYAQRDGRRFCINGVTGPDEYTAIVNNNYFTNLMAQHNLRYAAATVITLCSACPDAFAGLQARTGLEIGESAEWESAAQRMYLPYDEALGIHPQDDSFLDKELWDFANTPEDHYPLLLFYHPLNLYRHQVIKQADTLLAMFLLGNQFSTEAKKRNFDYYDPLTTHDSSLSVCIQSIIASEIGYHEKARTYFDFAVAMDLSDVGGNMRTGAHIASIGGSWMSLVYGFGGLRDYAGEINFCPRLPSTWGRLCYRLTVRGCRFEVEVKPEQSTYSWREGPPLEFQHLGEEVRVGPEHTVVVRDNARA